MPIIVPHMVNGWKVEEKQNKENETAIYLSQYIYIYIYIYMCVCMCVCVMS